MIVLGVESSCDECSVALVRDGREILGHVIATQIEIHKPYEGVVPELASRKHMEWIVPVFRDALKQAGMGADAIEGVAATDKPGLAGSLQVGFCFAKSFAWSRGLDFVGVNHIQAHLYAPLMERTLDYPFLGLLVSGGHTIICKVNGIDDFEVLGASIDDAVGEAFDKVAKHYGLGYPGGKVIDQLARTGDPQAFQFPYPNLYKGNHPYDVSYSGLKNAAVNQLDIFWNGKSEKTMENIAASFERIAVDTLVKKTVKAAEDYGLKTIVAGGGVAANSYLRQKLGSLPGVDVYFPPMVLCADNAAMIAGLGYHLLIRGDRSGWGANISPRVSGFRKSYP